jgi:hypothetical protein
MLLLPSMLLHGLVLLVGRFLRELRHDPRERGFFGPLVALLPPFIVCMHFVDGRHDVFESKLAGLLFPLLSFAE